MTPVSVDREQFASALSILERETDENLLSGCDRQFTWLNRVGYDFMIAANFIGFIVGEGAGFDWDTVKTVHVDGNSAGSTSGPAIGIGQSGFRK